MRTQHTSTESAEVAAAAVVARVVVPHPAQSAVEGVVPQAWSVPLDGYSDRRRGCFFQDPGQPETCRVTPAEFWCRSELPEKDRASDPWLARQPDPEGGSSGNR